MFADKDKRCEFMWIFSPDDMDEANRLPDGISSGYVGVAAWVDPS